MLQTYAVVCWQKYHQALVRQSCQVMLCIIMCLSHDTIVNVTKTIFLTVILTHLLESIANYDNNIGFFKSNVIKLLILAILTLLIHYCKINKHG